MATLIHLSPMIQAYCAHARFYKDIAGIAGRVEAEGSRVARSWDMRRVLATRAIVLRARVAKTVLSRRS